MTGKKTVTEIDIARGRAYAETQGLETGPIRTPEEDWAINRNALMMYGRARDWGEALKVLTYLSTRENHPDVHKALAQRAWLAVKTETPVLDTTLALFTLLVYLGPEHVAAPSMAGVAHLLAQHRTPEHPDSPLANAQSQQMLKYVAEHHGVEDAGDFERWVDDHKLEDPDHFIPTMMNALEKIIDDDWWFDHQAVQTELESDIEKRRAASDQMN
jgi:hypothetical protein